MGWISTFLSKAVKSGFILGFAVGIVINQVHSLLGVPVVEGSYVQQVWGTVEAIDARALARVHPSVLALWERAGAIDAIGKDRVFDAVRDAVHRLSDG